MDSVPSDNGPDRLRPPYNYGLYTVAKTRSHKNSRFLKIKAQSLFQNIENLQNLIIGFLAHYQHLLKNSLKSVHGLF